MSTNQLPDCNDRVYYPSIDDIRNHINKAKRAMRLSVLDQENALKLIEQWSAKSPTSHYYFRSYKENETKITNEEKM